LQVIDASQTKVHAIQILKIMSSDIQHGPAVSEVLDKIPGWDRYCTLYIALSIRPLIRPCIRPRRYKLQKHDLFVTKNEKVDYFLADSSNSGFKMITGGQNSGPS
jgi:hypothetical protein